MNRQTSLMIEGLKAYCDAYEKMTPQNYVSLLTSVIDPQVRFKDPFNKVKGSDQMLGIFQHMFQTLHQPEFEVIANTLVGNVGYIEWHFSCAMTASDLRKKEMIHIHGMSRVILNEQGKITEHIDFWDSGEVVFRNIPLLGRLNNWVAKKLAAPMAKSTRLGEK